MQCILIVDFLFGIRDAFFVSDVESFPWLFIGTFEGETHTHKVRNHEHKQIRCDVTESDLEMALWSIGHQMSFFAELLRHSRLFFAILSFFISYDTQPEFYLLSGYLIIINQISHCEPEIVNHFRSEIPILFGPKWDIALFVPIFAHFDVCVIKVKPAK